MEIFVDFVKAALATLCIFRSRRKTFVSLCLKNTYEKLLIDFVDCWLHLGIAQASLALLSVCAAIGFPFGRRTLFLNS